MGWSEILEGPAIDGGQGRVQLIPQERRSRTPVVRGDFFGPQPAGLVFAIVKTTGDAQVENVTGALPVADRQRGFATNLPGKTQLPGRLTPTVAFDQQAMLAGERLHGRSNRPEGVDDLRGNWRQA